MFLSQAYQLCVTRPTSLAYTAFIQIGNIRLPLHGDLINPERSRSIETAEKNMLANNGGVEYTAHASSRSSHPTRKSTTASLTLKWTLDSIERLNRLPN